MADRRLKRLTDELIAAARSQGSYEAQGTYPMEGALERTERARQALLTHVSGVSGTRLTADQQQCFKECLQVAYDSGHTDQMVGAPHRRDYAKTTGEHHLKLMHASGVGGSKP